MKLGGNIAGMVKKNADTIGFALGLFKDGTDAVFSSFNQMAQIHVPDFQLVLSDIMGDLGTPLTAYLAGMLLKGVKLPFIGDVGTPLQKGASGWIGGRIALALLYRSTHASGGSYAPSVKQNFASAPPIGYKY